MKRNSFAYRHIGPKAVDVDQMLSAITLLLKMLLQ